MNKEWRNMLTTLGIFMLIGLAIIFLISPNGYEDESYSEEKYLENYVLQWDHMPVTYSFRESLVGPITERIEWSFEILENATNGAVTFKEVEYGGDIVFVGHEGQNIELVDTYYDYDIFAPVELSSNIKGQASIEELGNIITGSEIEFWSVREEVRPASCWNFPRLELHDILHAFGFDHVDDDRYSIMYPYSQGCVARDDLITIANGRTFVPTDKLDE